MMHILLEISNIINGIIAIKDFNDTKKKKILRALNNTVSSRYPLINEE